jgi:hypothetical protein
MRRKHNPLVALLALLLLALIVTWICGGCSVHAEASETESTPRFTVENAGNFLKIITDNQTGEQYLAYYQYNTGIGLTKLEVE